MKRKMGIRGLLSRSAKNESREAVAVSAPISEDQDAFEIDYNNNKYVGRPPPLPTTVERELRDACEFVLRDLKPSGHDIEDRRMKSDMLVEHDPYKLDHKVGAAATTMDDTRSKRQHSAATWIMNENDSNRLRQPTTRKGRTDIPPENATLDTHNANRRIYNARPTTRDAPNAMSPLSSHAIPPVESPLAPMPTNVSGTRQPSLPASSKAMASPRPTQRAGSESTEGSMLFTPLTDQFKSASTAATSNASSNRASDNVYTQPASAKDGVWMKQEVEKHKQAQTNAPSIAGSAGATTMLAHDLAGEHRVSSRDAPAPLQIRAAENAEAEGNAHKRPTIGRRPSSRYSESSWNSQMQAASPTNAGASGRPGSTGSRRHSRPSSRLSFDGIHETKTSPQASPLAEEVPPVPRLDAQRLSSLTAGSRDSAVSPGGIDAVAQRTLWRDSVDPTEDDQVQAPSNAWDRTSDPQASVRPANMTSMTAPPADGAQTTSPNPDPGHQSVGQYVPPTQPVPTAANTSNPVQQPIHDGIAAKDQQPQSQLPIPPPTMTSPAVVVRDFYRPKQPLGADFAASYKRNDPTPADFENLMAAMDGAVHGILPQGPDPTPPTAHPSNAVPHNVPARRSSLQGQQKPPPLTNSTAPPPLPKHIQLNNISQNPESQYTTTVPAAPPLPSPENAGMVNNMSAQPRPHSQSGVPDHSQGTSQRSSYVSPTRVSDAHSSHTATSASSRRERRGLSKVLWRLGGGDVPQRRKIYVPPYAASGGYWDSDEEEACAAPVVGFGRGW